MTDTVSSSPPDAFKVSTGTVDEAREWIGRRRERRGFSGPIGSLRVELFAGALEDDDPRWWGGALCPPAMLMGIGLPLPWRPGAPSDPPPLIFELPLPGDSMIGTSIETEFHRPIGIDDRVSISEEVLSIGEEKRTRLGVGHFVVIRWRYGDERGEPLATEDVHSFRFGSGEGR